MIITICVPCIAQFSHQNPQRCYGECLSWHWVRNALLFSVTHRLILSHIPQRCGIATHQQVVSLALLSKRHSNINWCHLWQPLINEFCDEIRPQAGMQVHFNQALLLNQESLLLYSYPLAISLPARWQKYHPSFSLAYFLVQCKHVQRPLHKLSNTIAIYTINTSKYVYICVGL